MRQRVNLYPSELRPTEVKFSARQIVSVLGMMVILFVVGSLFQGVANYRAQAELSSRAKAVNSLNARLDTLRATHDVSKKRQQLDESRHALEREIAAQEKLLYLLRGEGANLEGFSTFLYGLARQHEPGLWLERFSFSLGGESLSFQGKSVKPELIFSYLDKLGHEASYQGKKFSTLSLLQDSEDKTLLAFEVQSESPTGLAEEASVEDEDEGDEDD